MAIIFHVPQVVDIEGGRASATATFYNKGTSTLRAVFSDEALSVSLGSSITADANGWFSPVWLTDISYRCVVSVNGVTLYDYDPVAASSQISSADIDASVAAEAALRVAADDALSDSITTNAAAITTLQNTEFQEPNPLASVAVATTANITLSGEQTIDGVATSTSRVLVKDQTDASENGVYVTAASAWPRADDANTAAELAFATVYVTAGSTHGDESYRSLSPSTITLETDDIEFTRVGVVASYLVEAEAAKTAAETAQTAAEAAQAAVDTTASRDLEFATLSRLALNAAGSLTAAFQATVASGGNSATVLQGDLGIVSVSFDLPDAQNVLVAARLSRAVNLVEVAVSDGTSGGGLTQVEMATTTADSTGAVVAYLGVANEGANQSPATTMSLRIDDRVNTGTGDIEITDVRVYDLDATVSEGGAGVYDHIVGAGETLTTLSSLASVIDAAASSDVILAYVKPGVYADDNLDCQDMDCTAVIDFAPGVRITNTPAVTGSCVQAYGTGTMTINGNGLSVEDFDTGTGNAFGSGGTATMIIHKVKALRCFDSFSAHEDSHMEVYDSEGRNSGKFGVAHVGNATSHHERCIFEAADGATGGIAVTENALAHTFVDCEFTYLGSTAEPIDFGAGTVATHCQFGSETKPVTLGGEGALTRCFVNTALLDGNQNLTLTDCAGYLTLRPREAAGDETGNSVVRGYFAAPSGKTSFVLANFTPGAGTFAPLSVDGAVLGSGFTTGLTLDNSTLRSYWDTASCTFTNNKILGSNIANAEGALATGVSGNSLLSGPNLGDQLIRSAIVAALK